MTVQLNLSPEARRVFQERATRMGRTLEDLLEEVVEKEARSDDAAPGNTLTDEDEFERGLDEFSEGLTTLPRLPADFARADIYGEHA